MKNNILLLTLFLCFSICQLTAQIWQYQPAISQVQWTGKAAFDSYSLSGTLQLKTAELTMDAGEIAKGRFVFDMKTIDGEIKALTKHLKSKDFFEVKKYKEAVFDLTTISEDDKGQKMAEGQLTVKGKTQTIRFPITLSQQENQIAIKGAAQVNRTAYGITYNSPSFFEKLQDKAIADEFTLNFDLVFVGN
ncbi:MAG: YceI family protein [Bacteroidota bacterium]